MPETLYPPRKYEYGSKKLEFEVLQASHRFLRDEGEDPGKLNWDDALAHKYYSSLYREYAVCDLKHFKSGNIALRWRTEEEVLSGVGENTCGNTRCRHHDPELNTPPSHSASRRWDDENNTGKSTKKSKEKTLVALELPFSYEEADVTKNALVKVVLCARCVKKLNWKRERERERVGGDNIITREQQPSRRSRSPSSKRAKDKDSLQSRDRHYERHDTKGDGSDFSHPVNLKGVGSAP